MIIPPRTKLVWCAGRCRWPQARRTCRSRPGLTPAKWTERPSALNMAVDSNLLSLPGRVCAATPRVCGLLSDAQKRGQERAPTACKIGKVYTKLDSIFCAGCTPSGWQRRRARGDSNHFAGNDRPPPWGVQARPTPQNAAKSERRRLVKSAKCTPSWIAFFAQAVHRLVGRGGARGVTQIILLEMIDRRPGVCKPDRRPKTRPRASADGL